jgi:hypothetical protein
MGGITVKKRVISFLLFLILFLEVTPYITIHPVVEASEDLGIIALRQVGTIMTVISINPVTGAHRTIKTIDVSSVFARDVNPENFHMRFNRSQVLDTNMDRLAVGRGGIGADNAWHVGWLDERGDFFDVTALITTPAQGGFEDSTVLHLSPSFGPDGYFYFMSVKFRTGYTFAAQEPSLMRVPLNNLVPDAVEVVIERVTSTSQPKYFIYPDGSAAQVPGDIMYSDASMSYWLRFGTLLSYSARQWVDQKTLLGVYDPNYRNTWEGTALPALVYLDAYHEGETFSGLIDSYGRVGGTRRLVLPANPTRISWDGVMSPDGTQIAFLSRSTGTSTPELFIASADGQNATRVNAQVAFQDYDSTGAGYRILAWGGLHSGFGSNPAAPPHGTNNSNPTTRALQDREIRFYSTIGNRTGSIMLPWGSSMFDRSSDEFNSDLANIAMALSLAAYDRDLNQPAVDALGTTVPGQFIDYSLYMLGFDSESILLSNYNQMYFPHGSIRGRPSPERVGRQRHRHDEGDPGHSVGYAFARQTITNDRGEEYQLVAVVVRGTQGNYGSEWFSNFDIFAPDDTARESGMRNEHYGFSVAAIQLRTALDEYIEADPMLSNAGNIKFLITGHSRGAAVANLVAYRLSIDNTHTSHRDVYAYTFATPNTVRRERTMNSTNPDNIFNFVNAEDFVPYMPLPVEGWDYWKWGQTWAFPSRNVVDNATFNRFYNAMQQSFRTLTGGTSHSRYTRNVLLNRFDGYTEVQRLVRDISVLAPTPWDYVDSTVASSPVLGNLTAQRFMKNVLARTLTYPPSSDTQVMLTAGFHAYHRAFRPVFGFFAAHHQLSSVSLSISITDLFDSPDIITIIGSIGTDGESRVMHAHAPETYLAWMMSVNNLSDMRTNYFGDRNPAFGGGNTAYLRARIACPVDVEIFGNGSNLIGSITDNANINILDDSASFFMENDVKYVILPTADIENYLFRLTGTDVGTMDFTLETVDIMTGRVMDSRHFANVPLQNGMEMTAEVGIEAAVSDTRLFVIENGYAVAEVQTDGSLILLAGGNRENRGEPINPLPVTPEEPNRNLMHPADDNGINTMLIVALAVGLIVIGGIIGGIIAFVVVKRKKGKNHSNAKDKQAGAMPISAPPTQKNVDMHCSKCGNKASGYLRFCNRCGNSMV